MNLESLRKVSRKILIQGLVFIFTLVISIPTASAENEITNDGSSSESAIALEGASVNFVMPSSGVIWYKLNNSKLAEYYLSFSGITSTAVYTETNSTVPVVSSNKSLIHLFPSPTGNYYFKISGNSGSQAKIYWRGGGFQDNSGKINKWLSNYSTWLSTYTRDELPNITNSAGVTAAHFHTELGRGGYFPPYAGTSESQFLALRGYLKAYEATGQSEWLNKALLLASPLESIFYKGMTLPSDVENDNFIWIPYWLVNAKEQAVPSEQFHLNEVVSFSNGVGIINKNINRIWSVRSTDSKLSWESPDASVIGTKYSVSNKDINDTRAIITLDEPVTGNLIVVYSDLTGPQIDHNEPMDAYPVWRKVKPGEAGAAIDSLYWAYDCFDLLYKHTNNAKWLKAKEATGKMIEKTHKVEISNDYLRVDTSSTNATSLGGTYIYDPRPNKTTANRNGLGQIVMNVPPNTDYQFVEIGNGNIGETWTPDKHVEVKVGSNVPSTVRAVINPVPDSQKGRWEATLKLNGSGIQTFDVQQSQFVNANEVKWGPQYRPDSQEGYVIKGPSSNVQVGNIEDEGITVKHITFTKYDYAQYFLTFKEGMPSSILPIKYRGKGISLLVVDGNGIYWTAPLPDTTSFQLVEMNWSNLKLNDYQTQSVSANTVPDREHPVTNYGFVATQFNSELDISYLGKLKTIPTGEMMDVFTIADNEQQSHQLTIDRVRPLPVRQLPYTPYVAPFSISYQNGVINDWRGMPYSGYQAPYIWNLLGKPEGTKTVMHFMEDASRAYEKQTGVKGPFAPVYLWERYDSVDFGEHDTFTWNGPDPNTNWGGFQYRALESVSRTWYSEPTNRTARRLTTDFLKMIDHYWPDASMPVLSNFPESGVPSGNYDEPHMAALILRSAVYARMAGADPVLTNRLIERCMDYLNRTFVDPDHSTSLVAGTWGDPYNNNSWYTYWGGEIVYSLSLLKLYMDGKLTYNPDFNIEYDYDKNGRLESVSLPSGQKIDYEYDANGNTVKRKST
ncbi:hypothetical protein [Paenibacillus sp. SI8]|uniref:hypothetical protein n=1 Tax=unclassified Paenibacillus TaxID=185978 RepID=UPI0034659E0D